MVPNLLKLLTYSIVFLSLNSYSQEIWRESFNTANKGVWGDDETSEIHVDFEGITSWSLLYSEVDLLNSDDYAKTVSTSGGRFECRDINAEVSWTSEAIDISEYRNVQISLIARETGSGANEDNKYLKALYALNGDEKAPSYFYFLSWIVRS